MYEVLIVKGKRSLSGRGVGTSCRAVKVSELDSILAISQGHVGLLGGFSTLCVQIAEGRV